MTRQINVLTSFNNHGLNLYGKNMLNSFSANWPKNIKMHVYFQDCHPKNLLSDNFELIDIQDLELLNSFKSKNSMNLKKNGYENGMVDFLLRRKTYRFDAIRFSHKSFAIHDCASRLNDGILLWIDADTIFHNKIEIEDILTLCPENADYGYFGRKNYHTETGLVYFNLSSKKCRLLLKAFIDLYVTGNLFTLKEWHDCEAFDTARISIPDIVGFNWTDSIQQEREGSWHPLVNSDWGLFLDHLKGGRKKIGRSLKTDLIKNRNESYWKDSNI